MLAMNNVIRKTRKVHTVDSRLSAVMVQINQSTNLISSVFVGPFLTELSHKTNLTPFWARFFTILYLLVVLVVD